MKTQVFCFGHELSFQTRKYLERVYGAKNVTIYKALFHANQMGDIATEAQSVIDRVVAQGADTSGNCRTLCVWPGVTAGGVAIALIWLGKVGSAPHTLNLMRVGDVYVPSPELPIIDNHSLKNHVGRQSRVFNFDGVETLAA